MKYEVLKLLKESGTTPAVIDGGERGVYFFEGDVFVLQHGEDFPFDDLDEEQQTHLLNELKEGRFVLEDSYGG
jgi:hypothetical protein